MTLKQFVEQKYCLACQGCCRFLESDSIWLPRLLNLEKRKLKINQEKLNPLKYKDFYICPYFLPGKNCCKIYRKRPFDCQLYPFLLNKNKNKVFLASDTKCPFIKERKETKEFKKYIQYLSKILQSKKFAKKIYKNPDFVIAYPQDTTEIMEFKKISSILNEAKST